jgi:hypothetical protein
MSINKWEVLPRDNMRSFIWQALSSVDDSIYFQVKASINLNFLNDALWMPLVSLDYD